MKIQVISIKPSHKLNALDVRTKVDNSLYTFEVKINECKIGEHNLQVASGGRHLWERLQYNLGAISEVSNLALDVYNEQKVTLPVMITNHLATNPVLETKAKRGSRQKVQHILASP